MRRLSFIVLVFGMLILAFLSFRKTEINDHEDLEKLEVNSRVIVEGIVVKENVIGKNKIIFVDDVEMVCACHGNFLGKKVLVEGFVEKFDDEKRLRILKIDFFS